MGFANCLMWRPKTPYTPYATYGTACKPLPGRLPRAYHHLPHKAPALAPPCAERPWAKNVMRSARGSSNLFLLLAVILSLLLCVAAALHPEAFSSGLLKHGRARRIRMRLSLRGHGSAAIKSWDELALHKAGLPGLSTPPSVVREGAGKQPPALKATAEDLQMGLSGSNGVARNATAASVATAANMGALISLLRGDVQRGRPEAAVAGEVPIKVAAGASSSGMPAANESMAQPAVATAAQPPPVDAASSAAVGQPPPAEPATGGNPSAVPGGAAGDTAAATEPEGKAGTGGDASKAAAVQPPPADAAAASADAVELARIQAREQAIAEVDRPFDAEYDDDFEGEAGRQKKRRPGLVTFDEDG